MIRLKTTYIQISVLLCLLVSPSSYSVEQSSEDASKHQALREATLVKLWSPVVSITGSGDSERAMSRMNEMVRVQDNITRKVEVDDQTQEFIDEFWVMFEKFRLEKLHNILPNEDGDWRKLNVYGYINDDNYRVESKPVENEEINIGETIVEFRSMPLKGGSLGARYLLESDASVVIGMSDWDQVTDSVQETLRILSGDTDLQLNQPDSIFDVYGDEKDLLKKLALEHPKLSESDLKVLTPIWYAYPNLWELLSSVSEIKNLLISHSEDDTIHSNFVFKLDTHKIKKQYPDFAKFLKKMGKLLELDISIEGQDGRFMHALFNTKELTLSLETYIRDGLILPYNPVTQQLGDRGINRQESWDLTANVTATVHMFGVKTKLHNIATDISFAKEGGNARIRSQTNETPDLRITGRALGIFPTQWIPVDMEEIMSEFLDVFFHGTNGQGIVAGMYYQKGEGEELSNINIDASVVGLDNLFVRIGMRLVNRKIIPNDHVSEDLNNLWKHTQEAFSKDLSRYRSLTANHLEVPSGKAASPNKQVNSLAEGLTPTDLVASY